MFHLRYFTLFCSCILLVVICSSHGSEIIGGKEVVPHSLPYMALLYNNKAKAICGGVLIDPLWVLTAAHCSVVTEVRLGVHSIKAAEKKTRQIQKVQEKYPHRCYDKTKKVNDLMLLKLKESVKATNAVKWLKLGARPKDPKAGSKCMVAGWGTTQEKRNSDVLKSVNVTVVDRKKCKTYYNSNPTITADMICAGSADADTCSGDSGGPLLCKGELVGVTSFGPEECGSKPGVYAFLSASQLTWVKKTMKKSDA